MPGPASLLETDPTVRERFLGLIRDGVPRAYAALGCGFSYDTLYGWVRRGLVPDAPEPYASFARELYVAEVELLRGWIASSIATDSKTLVWLLEHRFPKAFGRNAHEPADPAEDISRELKAAEESAGQLEAGGDGGELDEERWSVLEEWFYARPARLLELARKTGLAQAAVEESGGEKDA